MKGKRPFRKRQFFRFVCRSIMSTLRQYTGQFFVSKVTPPPLMIESLAGRGLLSRQIITPIRGRGIFWNFPILALYTHTQAHTHTHVWTLLTWTDQLCNHTVYLHQKWVLASISVAEPKIKFKSNITKLWHKSKMLNIKCKYSLTSFLSQHCVQL